MIDPANGRVAASHQGGLSLAQLTEFLDRGAREVAGAPHRPADSALAAGDAWLGAGQPEKAEPFYRRALALGEPGWQDHELATAQLVWALFLEHRSQDCAEMAAEQAPAMTRGTPFVRVVLAGFSSTCRQDTASWVRNSRAKLAPLAAEATQLAVTARNDRFVLYQGLMTAADIEGDSATVRSWGERWLGEIDATVPKNEDERTALDVARVDAVGILGTPERAIAALQASEKAMPRNYNASLRLAQVLSEAKRYDEALAACDRGLAKVDGPLGRTWLLETKGETLIEKGDRKEAKETLEAARRSANAIVTASNRDGNLRRISSLMAEAEK